MIQQKITEIAEILGWSVDFSEPQNGKTDVNFAKYTSYGQDFNFSVELEDDDMEAFIDNIIHSWNFKPYDNRTISLPPMSKHPQ